MPLKTRHVKFTKVSDTSVTFSFILAERDGVPVFQRGSVPDEANQAGQRGRITIPSAHHGSGQYSQRDPMKYDLADGWLCDEPGLLRTRGRVADKHVSLVAGQDCEAWGRGAVVPLLEDPTEIVYVTPDAIFQDATSKVAATTGYHFTGSYAKLGISIYYGQIVEAVTSAHGVLGKQKWLSTGHTFAKDADAANAGLFVASNGGKMWAVQYTATSQAWVLKWTDDIDGSDPLSWSANFSGWGRPVDLVTIGPHAVLIVQNLMDASCEVVSINTDGFVQNLLTNLPPVMFATPFLGGALLWHKGGMSATWMRDIGTFQHISWGGLSHRSSRQSIPNMQMSGEGVESILARGNVAGIAATATGPELFHSVYGKYSKADDTEGTGSTIFMSVFTDEGFFTHTLATPEVVTQLEDKFVMGMAVQYLPAQDIDNEWSRVLILMLAEPQVSGADYPTTDISVISIELWDGPMAPPSVDAAAKFWRSSWLHGDQHSLKQFRKLRFGGFTTEASGLASVIVWSVFVDGGTTDKDSGVVDLSTGKTHTISLDDDVIGRTIQVKFKTAPFTAKPLTIEMPIEVDYFTIPEQENTASMGILAGANEPDRMGGISPKNRKSVIADIETIRDSQERWTLDLWDGESWIVMPLDFQAGEVEGEFVGGAGAAVGNLIVQRLT